MPENQGFSCDGCYFRQELLCAIDTDERCPTFRPSVGVSKKLSRPTPAPLVELAAIPRPSVQRMVDDATSSNEPFASVSPEATFTVTGAVAPLNATQSIPRPARTLARDAVAGVPQEPELLLPKEIAAPQVAVGASGAARRARAAVRAAAARREVGASVIVQISEPEVKRRAAQRDREEPALRTDKVQLGRIAERVAARYPGTLQVC